MQDVAQVGTKRKRVPSGNENTQATRGSRTAGHRVKRRRALRDSSDEDSSEMEVDGQNYWEVSDNSDDAGTLDSCKSRSRHWSINDDVRLCVAANYLINEAPPRNLLRLRKDELVRIYLLAGLTEDAELLTKPEIVDCLIAARDDLASLPPSSPSGPTDSASSDYSSDGGNIAGGEETDFGLRLRNGLVRRATVNDLGKVAHRAGPERCFSLGEIDRRDRAVKKKPSIVLKTSVQPITRRRGLSNASSNHSSPSSSVQPSMLPSPPATRLRSRKASNEHPPPAPLSSTSSKGKGKAKQVEFSNDVQVEPIYPDVDQDSDLTDLTEVEESFVPTTPSPRRLRSKPEKRRSSSQNSRSGDEGLSLPDLGKRVTPMRKAKGRVTSLKEESTEEEDELEASDADDHTAEELDAPSLPTPKASRVRRTPMKRRLRSRRSEMLTPPSDGDDEGSGDESIDIEQSVDGASEEEEEGDDATVRQGSEAGDEDDPFSQPRTLRSGKVVGEDLFEDGLPELTDEDEGSSQDQDAASIDLDAEGDTEESEDNVEEGEDIRELSEDRDELMNDDIDLSEATTKTLVRLRRDDLVRLCEARNLDASGTKPQLAEALLQWRDQHLKEFAPSPSPTHTPRPPSTTRPRPRRRTRSKSTSKTPPVLMRSQRVHKDGPVTPPLTSHNKEAEAELELDLESLGLHDREIPPEKLTKLEKIGSGGFKDVFIGKFKGRKVAIAEFRGQLSAMDIKELKLLGDFDHPNIVRFLGVSIPENTKETPVMIVSELCSNGDLFDYIRNVPPPTLYRALCIMLDIARGLAYLHTRKPSVIHRDCKSSNILITSKGVAKITDFGLAKVKQSTRSMVRSLVGTVNWQAPELWHAHPKYNHKVDVFSCAMVFWEILQWHNPEKKFPWEGMNEHAIYDAVGAKHQRPSVQGLRKQWCPEIVDLIERMWAQDHQDRPTMTEVVQELERLVQKYR
ncbi:unnamed protein product [Somion occarium]|uniref:Protein kinase domain-containing protein n=1 Tax=Somion occarium TaxID=3059160 RepID=A0ABP1DBT6_9APHY